MLLITVAIFINCKEDRLSNVIDHGGYIYKL